MPRAGSSLNPLSKPETLVHQWAVDVQEWLYLPDPSPYYVVLATLIANMMAGEYVWMMFIGASGTGKTTAVEAIESCEKVFVVDVFEGRAGMLSGSSKKDRAKDATGGWLLQLGQRGLILCKEFTATLNQEKSEVAKAIADFRILSAGKFDRHVGSDGGKRIQWRGSVGFIGCSTSAIDEQHKVMTEMGARWLMYRFNEYEPSYARLVKGANEEDRARSMFEVQQRTKRLIEELFLEWSCHFECQGKEEHDCTQGPTRRPLESKEVSRLIAWGTFLARARSVVPRDSWTGEVNGLKDLESPDRAVKALSKLYLSMEILGLLAKERWPLIERLAWDSISPKMRSLVLRLLWQGTDEQEVFSLSMADVEGVLNVSPKTSRRVVGDLKVLELVKQDKIGGPIELAPWVLSELRKGRGR